MTHRKMTTHPGHIKALAYTSLACIFRKIMSPVHRSFLTSAIGCGLVHSSTASYCNHSLAGKHVLPMNDSTRIGHFMHMSYTSHSISKCCTIPYKTEKKEVLHFIIDFFVKDRVLKYNLDATQQKDK